MMVTQIKFLRYRIVVMVIVVVSTCMVVDAAFSGISTFSSVLNSLHRPQDSKQMAQSKQNMMLHMYHSPKPRVNPKQDFPTSAINLYSTVTFDSTLVSSGTIPPSRAAQGLLSPQTVMRLEGRITNGGQRSPALRYFLKTYHTYGPMACLPILSNPTILPELTRFMRDSSCDTRGNHE